MNAWRLLLLVFLFPLGILHAESEIRMKGLENRVDNLDNKFENKLETIQNRLTNLEQGTSTPEEYMINTTKATIIKHEINERTDNT